MENNRPQGPPVAIPATSAGPLTQDVEAIVAHVKATQLLGNRAARRFVGRNLNADTLANWRAHDKFPVGRRNPDARVHDDSGAEVKRAAATARAIREAVGR